jgi:hypothetical protein
VAARSKAGVGGHSLAGLAGSILAGDMGVCFEYCVCCQVEVPVRGSRSFIKRSPTDCGVSECHLKT